MKKIISEVSVSPELEYHIELEYLKKRLLTCIVEELLKTGEIKLEKKDDPYCNLYTITTYFSHPEKVHRIIQLLNRALNDNPSCQSSKYITEILNIIKG